MHVISRKNHTTQSLHHPVPGLVLLLLSIPLRRNLYDARVSATEVSFHGPSIVFFLSDRVTPPVTLQVSYYEIYQERIRDLLAGSDEKRSELRVREHPSLGPHVVGLTAVAVDGWTLMRVRRAARRHRRSLTW